MNLEGANKACEALHGSWIRGRVIEVNDATPKKNLKKRKITMFRTRCRFIHFSYHRQIIDINLFLANSVTSCTTPPGFDTYVFIIYLKVL